MQLDAAIKRVAGDRAHRRCSGPGTCAATSSTARSGGPWSPPWTPRPTGPARWSGRVAALTDADPTPGLVQATLETARFVATQLALAELDTSRAQAGPGRGASPAGPDQPALHLQRADRHRLVRAHRPGAGPGADPRVRRVHPVLVPVARGVHHARRRAALDRPLPDHRAGPVRRPAAGPAADRPRGAAGRPAVPLPAAAGRERGPARPVAQAGAGHGHHRGPGRRCRVRHHGGGRRGRHGPGHAAAAVRRRRRRRSGRRPARRVWPTWTNGCGPPSATRSVWWSRPASARGRR